MPELPEVETIVNDLAPRVQGRVFQDVVLEWPGCLEVTLPDLFGRAMAGQRIERLYRRGKYLLFRLSSGQTLIIHLGMTGRLYLPGPEASPDTYCTVRFVMDQGVELRLADPRKFGHVWLVDDPERVVGRLGPDALEESIGPDELAGMLSRRRGARIKAVLLDQTFMAGIGNIYADEALFEARIHPARAAGTLTSDEVKALREAVLLTLRRGIENRGTTFSDYRDGFGRSGKNQEALAVFHRTGKPCPRCGATIQRTVVASRGTHFCPQCQPQ